MGDPQVTIGFNTKMVIHNLDILDDQDTSLWQSPHFGFRKKLKFITLGTVSKIFFLFSLGVVDHGYFDDPHRLPKCEWHHLTKKRVYQMPMS